MRNSQRGVVMLETLFTFPLVLMTILAAWQLAELAVADLAVGWAARIAARSAAVHADEAALVAERAATQALRPLQRSLGMGPTVEVRLRTAEAASADIGEAARLLEAAHGAAVFEVTVRFDFPLRVPLAAALFGGSRTFERTANFPVMYAPMQ